MNAGLPGTGIGGLFYIASALVMPVHRLARGGEREGRSWRRIGIQVAIAASILGMLFLSGRALALLLAPVLAAPAQPGGVAPQAVPNLVRWVVVAGTAGLLAAVLLVVEAARLLVPRTAGGRRPLDAARANTDTRVRRGRRGRRRRRRRVAAGRVREVA